MSHALLPVPPFRGSRRCHIRKLQRPAAAAARTAYPASCGARSSSRAPGSSRWGCSSSVAWSVSGSRDGAFTPQSARCTAAAPPHSHCRAALRLHMLCLPAGRGGCGQAAGAGAACAAASWGRGGREARVRGVSGAPAGHAGSGACACSCACLLALAAQAVRCGPLLPARKPHSADPLAAACAATSPRRQGREPRPSEVPPAFAWKMYFTALAALNTHAHRLSDRLDLMHSLGVPAQVRRAVLGAGSCWGCCCRCCGWWWCCCCCCCCR